MGLKADFDEIAGVWSRSPWRVKAWLVLSGFLATASIASLSEVVFKWKAFFLDAVTFLREYVREPVHAFLSLQLGISVPRGHIDAFAIFALIATSFFRSLTQEYNASTKRGRLQIAEYFAPVALSMLYFLWNAAHLPQTAGVKWWIVWLLYLFVLALAFNRKGASRLLGVVYLVVPPLAVGILAAINAGLSR